MSPQDPSDSGAVDPSNRLLDAAPTPLPTDCIDLLVVGGGPAGTAAAFRATELGLRTFVVDFDDLMKRIRDYSKDKLILPSFGGGDRLAFPAGGELVESLQFGPIDKDEMCQRWKGLYRQHEVPFASGVELLGVEGEAAGPRNEAGFSVRVFDHRERCEAEFHARAIALALGRGVPRRFDIPGNTEGMAFRLTDPNHYVGAPACVVGGGTSAAEAVIAISQAKAAARDPTEVYWSYRGDRMPRVSQALADAFFAAYIGNGNIRYFPRSEPMAILDGDDHCEYLSLRVDRRQLVGRPNETSHLEFHKERCLACIGEDLPEPLLNSIGIRRVEGGPKARTRVVVSPILESCRPNVFLLGDLLSQAYLETDDFAAAPATFREVSHRGNIKTALRDGVLVAEAVAQRLQGVAAPVVTVGDAESAVDEGSPSLAVATEDTILATSDRRTVAPAPVPEPSAAAQAPSATVLRVLPGGDTEEMLVLAAGASVRIGRTGADLDFPHDGLLADHHATLEVSTTGQVLLRHAEGASGTFLRLEPARRTALETGDLLQVGRQFLQLDSHPRLIHFDARGEVVGRYPLDQHWQVFGRESPDVTLDAGDRSLSRRHLALAVVEGQVLVKDLRSANGSYLRLRRAAALEHGARFRVGKQQLAVALGSALLDLDVPAPRLVEASVESRDLAAAPAASHASGAPITGPSVTFQPDGVTLAVAAGQSLCDVAEAHGVRLKAECHAGICGSDPLRIVSGHEHLVPLGEQESETLEDVCELEPGPCRLACMTRITGPVVVEIVGAD